MKGDDATALLLAWGKGDQAAFERLVPIVHAELHRIAMRCMSDERAGHSLQATALVNEAYMRLVNVKQVKWQDRTHFLSMAARLMRRVLVEHARRRQSLKRGPANAIVPLEDDLVVSAQPQRDFVALDDALGALSAVDERKSRVVELRFFGGLTVEETADVLNVSVDTVMRDWKLARAWLLRELRGGPSPAV
jgi:RNA polymerase sigma factor (TIGR02999 family)